MFNCNGAARCFHETRWMNHCQRSFDWRGKPVWSGLVSQQPKHKSSLWQNKKQTLRAKTLCSKVDFFFTFYECQGEDWGCDLPLKPLILPVTQRLSCKASCSQGLGLGETIALWLSSQCNHSWDEYRGIKFQSFGRRALTHSNQSFWERILNFTWDPRVHHSLSNRPQFLFISLFREGRLLFRLFSEQ